MVKPFAFCNGLVYDVIKYYPSSLAKKVLETMRRFRKRKELVVLFLIGLLIILICIQRFAADKSETFQTINASFESKVHVLVTPSRKLIVNQDVVERQRQSLTCARVNNVAFIKTHKAGSSTIANILQRYGIEQNLNFALPRRKINTPGYNYIVRPGDIFTADNLIPLPPGQRYNILWNHSVYNKTAFRKVLPNDTVYITILREPFQQFVSSFEYYGVMKSISKTLPRIINDPNPVSTFLKLPFLKRAFSRKGQYGYVQNKQAQDLGFRQMEYANQSQRSVYIRELEHDFSFVMIMEYFDESLLILKHKLCWDMRDILYIPKNRNYHKPNRTFTSEDHKNHRMYSPVDYSLYNYFLKIYHNIIEHQNSDFFQELSHYKNLLRQVKDNCSRRRAFLVPETRWHKAFRISNGDCKLMMISELQGLKRLLSRLNNNS